MADAAVDPLAEQVGVAEVAGVLLDHVEYHLAQRDGGAVLHGAADGEVRRAGDELLCESDLLTPGPPGVGHRRRISHRPRPVSVLGIIGPVQRRRVGPGHHPPEPVALHVGHMADQAEQRHGGGRHRAQGQLLCVEVGALQFQRQPVGTQVVQQRRPLAVQLCACREPRVLRRIHPHVGLRANRVPASGYRVPGALLRHGDQPVLPYRGWPAE